MRSGVSRTDMRGIKIMNLKIMLNKFEWKEPISQMSMIWRLESSWVYLTLFIKDSCTCCVYRLSIVVDLWYDLMYTIFYFELADDTYSVFVPCTDPYLYLFSWFNCGVQQTCRRLQLNRNSSQSSLHRISGLANASSLDWVFLFMSWCLELPALTSFYLF